MAGNIQHTKFTIRNYLAGGYSDLHIIKNDEGIFDIEISNAKTPYNDGKEDDIIEQCSIESRIDPLQQILFGAPGTGKSHAINSDASITEENSIRTTFHPDSDYSTFVGCYKPTKDEERGEITYDFTPQAFTNAYVAAWQDIETPFYLIIEEINRGNCAQIFGDIFQLLDRDEKGYSSYKTTPDQDLANYICKQFADAEIGDAEVKSGRKMQLPPNLHIWATMNTSDQSLFPIDSAFKRRWDWRYIPIDYTDRGHFIACGYSRYSWSDFLRKVNERVESVTQSEDKKLGYWFMGNGAEQKEITVDRFVSKVVFYLWNDVFKDFGRRGNTIFKDSFAKFHMFFNYDGSTKVDVVRAFLDALEVKQTANESVDEEDDDDSQENTEYGARENKQYLINDGDKSYKKRPLPFEALKKYVRDRPSYSAQQVIDEWKDLSSVSHFIESREEHAKTLVSAPSWQESSKKPYEVSLNNGEKLYIAKNGWTTQTINEFVNNINAKNWGISIKEA